MQVHLTEENIRLAREYQDKLIVLQPAYRCSTASVVNAIFGKSVKQALLVLDDEIKIKSRKKL